MLVKLKRDLYAGEVLYKARLSGTEMPDTVDGKPVVEHADPRPNSEVSRLPRDAEILSAPIPVKDKAEAPVALSKLGKAPSKSFKEAIADIDD